MDQGKKMLIDNMIGSKIEYLLNFQRSIDNENIPMIYQLLDSARYNSLINGWSQADDNRVLNSLVESLRFELAEFTAPYLIDYLKKYFPFFKIQKKQRSVYSVTFGYWPSAREIGLLDTLRVEIVFDKNELSAVKEYMNDQKKSQDDDVQIQELNKIQTIYQKKSDATIQAIKKNEEELIKLSKKRAVLKLEQEQIEKYFGSFEHFIDKANHLYVDYINHLLEDKNEPEK
ncbi:hypothetical protein ACKP2L_04625 [Oenococcus alcoholitolerans]|uniref:hypothetical protein n=1 Tax=Oenococcus alcoholitolerans TaxID=931074 RepID=UPI003F72B682